MIARQLGRPRGLVGRLVGRLLARSNRDFGRWVVAQLGIELPDLEGTVVEVGQGPGVALAAALVQFPRASFIGVDLSPEMVGQARRRNRAAIKAGRLTVLEGSVESLATMAPFDLVYANHVLYFWRHPDVELARLHGFIRPGGRLALGYQLGPDMPAMAQKHFPEQGHLLYRSLDDVERLLRAAGFSAVKHLTKGPADAPHGRLTIATA